LSRSLRARSATGESALPRRTSRFNSIRDREVHASLWWFEGRRSLPVVRRGPILAWPDDYTQKASSDGRPGIPTSVFKNASVQCPMAELMFRSARRPRRCRGRPAPTWPSWTDLSSRTCGPTRIAVRDRGRTCIRDDVRRDARERSLRRSRPNSGSHAISR